MFVFSEEEEGQLITKNELKHSSEYQQSFEKWLGSNKQKEMLELIAQNCTKEETDEAIELMSNPNIAGMVYIYNQERWAEDEFLFLFDFLAMSLQRKGYVSKTAVVEQWQYSDYSEKIQRTHLIGKKNHLVNKVLLSLYYQDGKMESMKCCGCNFSEEGQPSNNQFHSLLAEIVKNPL